MKRIGADTNGVLSFLTDRDPKQQARAAELFGAATSGGHVVVLHQAVIAETVYVLCNLYGEQPRVVSAVMRDLLALPGVVTAHRIDWPPVWRSWPHHMKDFGDACLTVAAKHGAFDVLATFDTGFARQARRQGVATYW